MVGGIGEPVDEGEAGQKSGQGQNAYNHGRTDSAVRDAIDHSLDAERLRFAVTAFHNAQELNRAIDTEARRKLASVGLLTGALGLLASGVISGKIDLGWPGVLRAVALGLILVYLLLSFATTYQATVAYRPAANTLRPDTLAPGMLFPLMLLKKFKSGAVPDEDVYMSRLMKSTSEDLIYDYVNQIMENSNIYFSKQQQMNKCIALFQWLSILWVISMIALVAVTVLAS